MRKAVFGLASVMLLILTVASASSQKSFDRNDLVCRANARLVALGILMYASDWDNRLPPMRSPAALQTAVFPYVKAKPVFLCPAWNSPYAPVSTLSGKNQKSIKSPSSTVIFRCPRPHKTGVVFAGYADGHAAAIKRPPPSKK